MTKPGPKPKDRSGPNGTFLCIECKEYKRKSEFYGATYLRHSITKACKACYSIRRAKQYKERPLHYNEAGRRYNRRLRLAAIKHYGGKCACCGETQFEFLAIDHINGGGLAHRREIGSTSKSMAGWLKKNNYPAGFRILCHNCNMAKAFYGRCPHEPAEDLWHYKPK